MSLHASSVPYTPLRPCHGREQIYSPAVTTTVSQEYSQDSQEDSERFHFDVKSVQKEIKRGKNLRCTLCKRNGATVGCDIKTCKRNYHYPCVIKAKGSPSRYKYVVYCAVHKNKKNNGTKDFENAKKCMQRRGKKKKLQNMAAKRRKNNIKKPLNNEVTSNEQVNEPSECSFILPIHTIETEDYEGQIDKIKQFWSPTCYRRDDIEHEPVPSTSAQCMSSGTSSEESVSLLSPQVKKVFSLSGLPKRKKKHASKSTPSKELTEVLQGMSSQERKDLSQIYSELGGSYQDPAIEMDSTSENQNVTESAEDTLTTDVTDVSTSSSNDEIDKTPETLPDINVHGNSPRCSTEENQEQTVSSRDEKIPDNMTPRFSKKGTKSLDGVISKIRTTLFPRSSDSNIKDSSCMSTPDTSAYPCSSRDLPDTVLLEYPEGTHRPVVNGSSSVTHSDIPSSTRIPPEQIHSTNCEDTSSQPTKSTEASKSVKTDTLVGCSSDFINEQQATNLGAQGNSDRPLSGHPTVREPESGVCSSLTLEKDGNKTEASTNVSDASLENMENDLSASQHFNREILPVASPSNVATRQNEKKTTISNFVSPKQIKDISRKLVTGTFTRQLKSILPQIKITLDSPKRNLTKNTEQKDGHAISAESPHSSTDDQSSTRPRNDLCKPLENQERTGGLIEENDQVPLESSESDTSKRKRSQDLEELMPNMKRQQTERPEQLEIFEDQTEYHLRENVTSESECASEHHSGPSRMTPPLRRLSFDSSCQNERVDDLDDIDGFGRAVAGQCRLLLQEKQTKYMSYVLAAADLFRRHSTLPELDILITNLRTVLEKSQTSTHCSSCGSSV
ncbi:PHD finger protein 11 isoform X2 [Dendropsophus ebraccatus]|uniref:PHD finger protein 11 isoform X2 n=1 Tax=Dendropsophus ebraccatus TaxID=150705 RepID=UPI0038312BFC